LLLSKFLLLLVLYEHHIQLQTLWMEQVVSKAHT